MASKQASKSTKTTTIAAINTKQLVAATANNNQIKDAKRGKNGKGIHVN